uniref:Putative ovule protein n=1 Tax=Solanum chacoense TaxID=4108 RepID=A0A0V0HZ97_SOLCH
MTPPGTSATGSLDSPSVLLFSSILPALISFTSFIVFGPESLSLGHCAIIFSLREPTVVAGVYLLGPISLPSASLNLISINSFKAIQTISHNHQSTSNSHQSTKQQPQTSKNTPTDQKLK